MIENKCVVCVGFFLAFCCFIGGIALIIIGSVVTLNYYKEFFGNEYAAAPVIFLVCGILFLVIVVSKLVLIKLASCFKFSISDKLYGIIVGSLLLATLIATFTAGIIGLKYTNNLESFLKNSMNESFVQQNPKSVNIWNDVQSEFHCCGINGSSDYEKYQLPIPDSCCEGNLPNCEVLKEGCFDQVLEQMKMYISLFGGFGVGLPTIQVLACIFPGIWYIASKNEYEGI